MKCVCDTIAESAGPVQGITGSYNTHIIDVCHVEEHSGPPLMLGRFFSNLFFHP